MDGPDSSPGDSPAVSLTIPATAGYVGLARLALAATCRLTPLDAEQVADLKLALTEGAAGYVVDAGEREPPRLRFDFVLEPDRLVVHIGGPPKHEAAADERELGRAILEATVDEWSDGDGTLSLVKYLTRRDE